MADEVKWQFDVPRWDGQLAKCGKWIAEFAFKNIYSEGLVFIKYTDDASAFWGQKKALPEADNAIALIDATSKIMVRGLTCSQSCKCTCQLVYVASLNEGDFNHVQEEKPLSVGLHFWLLPRYEHDYDFLTETDENGIGNDGFALMAHWRRQHFLRKRSSEKDKLLDFQKCEDKSSSDYKQYAERTRAKLRKTAEDLGLYS